MRFKHSLWWFVPVFGLSLLVQSSATAHFPWLLRDEDGKAILFFGESLNDRTYALPPSIAKGEISRLNDEKKLSKLTTTTLEEGDFVGLISDDTGDLDSPLAYETTYGAFRGNKLEYYALCFGKLSKVAGDLDLQAGWNLQADVMETDDGVSVVMYWQGRSLAHAKIKLYDAQGRESAECETDTEGKALFADAQIHEGWNAILVGHAVPTEGRIGDASYSGEMHYLTATFKAAAVVKTRELAALPFPITSFGAATDGKSLYVYGGHTGEAHSYSAEGQSDKLMRLDLIGPQQTWQEVATGARLQGTAMIAFENELVVIGGFQARNQAGEPKDLHSLADVRSFDTVANAWSELPSLPEPRSSHDAALIGSTVYVVGGWELAGNEDAGWHTTSWKMDLSATNRRWEPIPDPPFQRRALATIAHNEKLVVVGGMNQDGNPTRAVAAFDPQSQLWSTLPEIAGEEEMAGFGASGWSVNGNLIVTSQEGDIEQLVGGESWKTIGKTSEARFFHRILPVGTNEVAAIGGANMSTGKIVETEVITIP